MLNFINTILANGLFQKVAPWVILITAVVLSFYMIRKGINLGYVMLIDTALLCLGASIPLSDSIGFFISGISSITTLRLIYILFMIMCLENTMRTTGMINKIVSDLRHLLGSNRAVAAMLPSVLGLLPSPGGARFSCPMVEEASVDAADSETKAFVNYWFRHIWLDGFILYPGVILASNLLGKSVLLMFVYIFPFMVGTVLIGIFTGVIHIKKIKTPRTIPVWTAFRNFLNSMTPITSLISLYIVCLYFPWSSFIRGFALEVSATIMVIILFFVKKYDFKRIRATAKEAFPVKLVTIVIGVMIFKEALLGSKLLDNLPETMAQLGLSPVILFLLLPFIGGVTSGITVSYVSMTFPILIPLGLGDNLWYAAMAFVAGSIGNAITPLHLCAVMSSDYFKTPLSNLLRRVAKAELSMTVFLVIIAAFFILAGI